LIDIQRIYDSRKGDGYRVMVDRIWPRGISSRDIEFDEWMKRIAPSDRLRKWFGHDPERWEEFKERYFEELDGKTELVRRLREKADDDHVVLLYSARDANHNNALALKEYLEDEK
jgi:uncharacterized protein YeaO (DUF488 family)